ncbi:hypothetical protein [uncultured Treponema sp.]|uniref:hypothetical protein n=1 Tax=uncultured Treponema sp. TaxID=162155 RepID=UPI0025EC6F68|nr:hypothetical protein [uncultured Treponema sp.]
MKKPITIISSISIILFLTAIVWFGAGIYIDKKTGTQNADSRFEKLLNDTKENFSRNAYGSPEFSNSFIHAIGNIDDFSSLKLEVNGNLVYSYPPEIFTIPSPELIKSYTESISLENTCFTLKASIYLMKPLSIYNHSKVAFLLILAGTIAVGIFLVLSDSLSKDSTISYTPSKRKTQTYRPIMENKASERAVAAPEPVSNKTEEKSIPEQKEIVADSKPAEKAPVEEKSNSEEVITISFDDNQPLKSENPIFDPEKIIRDEENIETVAEQPEDEKGLDIIDQFEQANQEFSDGNFLSDSLFSEKPDEIEKSVSFDEPETQIFQNEPESNTQPVSEEQDFDFEEPKIEIQLDEKTENTENADLSPITNLYFQASLNQKLNEVIKNEGQAVLVLIKINGLDRGNFISQEIISILKTVQSKVLLFEYKADAYATILRGVDLQAAVDIFEEVYNKVADFLKDNNAVNEVSIGISSVSGRNVDAERVSLEANQALEYASQDPDSPIVAFRVNPEKYREVSGE